MVAEHQPQPDIQPAPDRMDVTSLSQYDTGTDSIAWNAAIITGRQIKRRAEDLGDVALNIGATALLTAIDVWTTVQTGISRLPKI